MNVDVAVIPCAGAGTRMRPATRIVPKPLIPVVDRPVIQYVVEEAVHAGITEVILVVDERPGDPVMAHFTDGDAIEGLEHVTFTRVVQASPLGLGHAVLCAADAVGDRPFMTLLSDMFPRPERTFAPRLARVFDGRTTVAVRPVPKAFFDRYGIVATGEPDGDVVPVTGAIEKPGADAPSDLGLVGRYVFGPDLFDVLRSQDTGFGGELQLTDAIDTLARSEGAIALVVGDDLLDIGMPAGLLEATAVVGLSRPDLAASFREAIAHLM
jgi:UTP--glucose-1-phosphate uridylyltransferase